MAKLRSAVFGVPRICNFLSALRVYKKKEEEDNTWQQD
jgi:hypothetical protein